MSSETKNILPRIIDGSSGAFCTYSVLQHSVLKMPALRYQNITSIFCNGNTP